MLKFHSPFLISEAHSHLRIGLTTIEAQKGKICFTRDSRAGPKAHVGAEGGEMFPRFMPIGVRKVPLFDLVSNQGIWIVSINMAINMLMELPIQLIHYA